MTSESWEQIKQLFQAALDQPPDERPGFILKACQGKESVRTEVENLLLAHEQAGDFLEKPPLGKIGPDIAPPKNHVLSIGEVISSRFEVIGFLGQGGMGEVYEARDLELGERLALKAIRPEISSDPRVIARFKHEVQLARRVAHPNVCRVFDFGRHQSPSSVNPGDGTAINFLTMELLRGETLASRLRRAGRMTASEAFPIVRQMVDGLAAAHQVGVIHRDFKPSNVILVPTARGGDLDTGEVRAVVTDFGLARTAVSGPSGFETLQSSLTAAGHLMGTISYMSPEQLEGGETGPATDIYALGLVIYEMVTGQRPFSDETPFAVAVRRLREAPPSPRVHVPELDSGWEATILRCLQIDPAVRFQRTRQVLQALSGEEVATVASPEPSHRPSPSSLEDRHRGSRTSGVIRLRLAVVACALVLVALILLVGRRLVHWNPTSLPEGAAVLVTEVKNETGDEQLNGITELIRSELAQSSRFSLMDSQQVDETLERMTKSKNAPLDPVTAREVAWRGGAPRVVFETLSPVADGYALEVDVQEVGRDPTTYPSHERKSFNAASKQALFDAVRECTRWIRRDIGESLDGIGVADRPPEDITTPSWEALDLFMRARKTREEYRLVDAIGVLKQAIVKDPKFAMAYMLLGDTYDQLGDYRDGYANFESALGITGSRRLTKREELRIRGVYAMDRNDLKSALAAFDAYESFYPNDYLGPIYRAGPLLMLDRPEEAVSALEEAQHKNPKSFLPFYYMAGSNLVMRHFDDSAKAVVHLHEMGYPDAADYFEGASLFMQGQYDQAIGRFRGLRAANKSYGPYYPYYNSRSYQMEANVLAELGRQDEAIGLLNQSLAADVASGRDNDRADKLMALAYLYLAKGNRAASRTACLKALGLDGSLVRSRDAGSLLAQAGYVADVRRVLSSRDPGNYPPISEEVRHRLQGEIFLAEGGSRKALEQFDLADKLAPPIEDREYLARALVASGRLEEAWTLYKQAAEAQGQIWYNAELHPPGLWAEMLYHYASLGLKLGKPEAREAAGQYRKLRQSADPDVPKL